MSGAFLQSASASRGAGGAPVFAYLTVMMAFEWSMSPATELDATNASNGARNGLTSVS